MNLARVIRWIFIALLIVTLLTLATPLAFASVWLRNAVYVFTIALSFFVAGQLKPGLLKTVITWLPISGFVCLILTAFAFSFADRISDDWRTSWISHRQLKHKKIYIGEQMLDVGALGYTRRTVKVIPVTPLFRWITRVDTSSLDGNWISVNESYNPYNLKH